MNHFKYLSVKYFDEYTTEYLSRAKRASIIATSLPAAGSMMRGAKAGAGMAVSFIYNGLIDDLATLGVSTDKRKVGFLRAVSAGISDPASIADMVEELVSNSQKKFRISLDNILV